MVIRRELSFPFTRDLWWQLFRHSCLFLLCLLLRTTSLPGQATERAEEMKQRFLPMLQEHCLDCHSGAEPDAGLSLDHFETPLSILKGRSVWEKAVQKIQIGEMPPPDSSSLSDANRKYMMRWLEETIEDVECGLAPNPGKVTLRRLNAIEYRNTIRDLFDLQSYEPQSSFPGDDIGYGFDNIGDVLTLPPLLMEKYFLEAERISRAIIQAPPPAETVERSWSGNQLQIDGKQGRPNRELTLTTTSEASVEEEIPFAAPFQLVVRASGDQAGDQPCLMSVSVDGKMVRRFSVPNERSNPRDFSVTLRLRKGKRTIAIGFLNDFYKAGSGDKKQDRNLIVHHVSLSGRKASTNKLPPESLSRYHRRIVFTTPKNDADRERATREVVEHLASRAFRRPVDPANLQRLVELAMSVQEEGDSFEESIRIAAQAILISPKFLFRVEPPVSAASFDEYRSLDEFELATRLSYFLWSSMPDDELLKLAWEGRLRQGNVLEQQIARMIKDPRSNEFVRNFAGQWLTLRRLKDFRPDPRMFPQWNDDLRGLLERETLTFFAGIMRGNQSVLDLLAADYTYMNEDLARYYGVGNVRGDHFRPVKLEGTQRSGLLTHASILAVTSNPTRTSPVKRGKWVLENLLATPPPPAPPGVPELQEKGPLSGTLRQRLQQHRADPACAGCHKLMDPIGFALEHFDAVGRYRSESENLPIDASGKFPDGTEVVGADALRKLLLEKHRDDFVECLVEKMLTYALGRGLEYFDQCAVDKIVQSLEDDNYRFSTLLVEIVRSDPFQKKGERVIE